MSYEILIQTLISEIDKITENYNEKASSSLLLSMTLSRLNEIKKAPSIERALDELAKIIAMHKQFMQKIEESCDTTSSELSIKSNSSNSSNTSNVENKELKLHQKLHKKLNKIFEIGVFSRSHIASEKFKYLVSESRTNEITESTEYLNLQKKFEEQIFEFVNTAISTKINSYLPKINRIYETHNKNCKMVLEKMLKTVSFENTTNEIEKSWRNEVQKILESTAFDFSFDEISLLTESGTTDSENLKKIKNQFSGEVKTVLDSYKKALVQIHEEIISEFDLRINKDRDSLIITLEKILNTKVYNLDLLASLKNENLSNEKMKVNITTIEKIISKSFEEIKTLCSITTEYMDKFYGNDKTKDQLQLLTYLAEIKEGAYKQEKIQQLNNAYNEILEKTEFQDHIDEKITQITQNIVSLNTTLVNYKNKISIELRSDSTKLEQNFANFLEKIIYSENIDTQQINNFINAHKSINDNTEALIENLKKSKIILTYQQIIDTLKSLKTIDNTISESVEKIISVVTKQKELPVIRDNIKEFLNQLLLRKTNFKNQDVITKVLQELVEVSDLTLSYDALTIIANQFKKTFSMFPSEMQHNYYVIKSDLENILENSDLSIENIVNKKCSYLKEETIQKPEKNNNSSMKESASSREGTSIFSKLGLSFGGKKSTSAKEQEVINEQNKKIEQLQKDKEILSKQLTKTENKNYSLERSMNGSDMLSSYSTNSRYSTFSTISRKPVTIVNLSVIIDMYKKLLNGFTLSTNNLYEKVADNVSALSEFIPQNNIAILKSFSETLARLKNPSFSLVIIELAELTNSYEGNAHKLIRDRIRQVILKLLMSPTNANKIVEEENQSEKSVLRGILVNINKVVEIEDSNSLSSDFNTILNLYQENNLTRLTSCKFLSGNDVKKTIQDLESQTNANIKKN